MSLIKGKREKITILDFSNVKVSKNKIKLYLKDTNINDRSFQDKILTIFDNYIRVGMYDIKLVLAENYEKAGERSLKEYGGFQVKIFENNREIILNKDNRFKSQYWNIININNQLRLKNLTDIIFYCKRLYQLKLFL